MTAPAVPLLIDTDVLIDYLRDKQEAVEYGDNLTEPLFLSVITVAELSADETSTLIIVQSLRPDQFFTAAQQQRLDQLMTRWRAARDQGMVLPEPEQAELESLIETELRAAAQHGLEPTQWAGTTFGCMFYQSAISRGTRGRIVATTS